MSLKSIIWALEEAPVTDPTELLVLIALADRATDTGEGAYPSRQWLAERARVSVSTVKRKLHSLEDCGVIRRGDQQLVDHYRPDRRPVVWDIDMSNPQMVLDLETRERGFNCDPSNGERGSTGEPWLNLSGGSSAHERGFNCDPQTVPSSLRKKTVPSSCTSKDAQPEESRRPELAALVNELGTALRTRGDKIPAKPDDWYKHARLIIDRDKRDPVEALEVLQWAILDDFWSPNIKSMRKFRNQYDVLRHKSEKQRKASTAATFMDRMDNL